MTSVENVITINNLTGNACSDSGKLILPIQSCAHVCGVIVVCMAQRRLDTITCAEKVGVAHTELLYEPQLPNKALAGVLNMQLS